MATARGSVGYSPGTGTNVAEVTPGTNNNGVQQIISLGDPDDGNLQAKVTAGNNLQVSPAAGAPVALSTPPTTLNAGSATALTFASTVRHIEIQNNTSETKGVEFAGTAATVGSFQVLPGQYYPIDVATTQVSIYGASASNLNGSTAGNLVVRGYA